MIAIDFYLIKGTQAPIFAIKINKRRVENKAVGHKKAWLGLAAEDDISVMESPQPLVDHPLACDAVWFGGGSKDGTYIVMSGQFY